MNIAIVGTGYVGLVTGVCLADIGHNVTCIDINKDKVSLLNSGTSPIYEPGLDKLLNKNLFLNNLRFTNNYQEGLENVEVVYIAIGTPQKKDGNVDLTFILKASREIAINLNNSAIIVVKSTVPVGTNELIREIIIKHTSPNIQVDVVSNPEFLREGNAIYDTFNADRIVIGSSDKHSESIVEEIYKPFNIPIFKTDIRSAEMIKYASNTFLATKISFINEISTICEKVGANVDDVACGIGKDERIGNSFLHAGIGYGGSCFPKDTSALIKIAADSGYEFKILKSVIEVNDQQKNKLISMLKNRIKNIAGRKIAILGLSFKPNTDDMRESPAIPIINYLINEGAEITAYDPVAINNAKKLLPSNITYTEFIEDCLLNAHAALILTDWQEICSQTTLKLATNLMSNPIIFDGRNCFDLQTIKNNKLEYYSIGRPPVKYENEQSLLEI